MPTGFRGGGSPCCPPPHVWLRAAPPHSPLRPQPGTPVCMGVQMCLYAMLMAFNAAQLSAPF